MKQKIGSLIPETQVVSDMDMVFMAMYNLMYDRVETEPNKGIVVCKGKPNQRKATWKEVLVMAHMLEDYFMCKRVRNHSKECFHCKYWESISKASPHLGRCNKRAIEPVHMLETCKKFKERPIDEQGRKAQTC